MVKNAKKPKYWSNSNIFFFKEFIKTQRYYAFLNNYNKYFILLTGNKH